MNSSFVYKGRFHVIRNVLTLILLISTITIAPLYALPSSNISNGFQKSALRNTIKTKCNTTCDAPCRECINGTCETRSGSCYIAGRCYEADERRFEDNLSCLKCQPYVNKDQWTFNPACSSRSQCSNPIFLLQHICNNDTISEFYKDHEKAVVNLFNYQDCTVNSNKCEAGYFYSETGNTRFVCCPGFFCPEGQTCMIPCRRGSYCPTELEWQDGTCRSPVKCPSYPPKSTAFGNCGGSIFEGFCPAESYCPTPAEIISCQNSTQFCPTGVEKPLSCPTHFVCRDGRARRTRVLINVVIAFIIIIIFYVVAAKAFEHLSLKKKIFGQESLNDTAEVSDYFKPTPKPAKQSRPKFELNIYLHEAKLRNVTRFDPSRNNGFTGCIYAGRLTALMGGSGCGKSSLLETIYGRRQLRPNGHIKFGDYEPLDNILTDYVGYVPQADIMHDDLTVFETVYYSARARRLEDPIDIIKNDVCFVLEKLGLKLFHNNITKTLSGGQRKRVNVAMEVAACPKVLLLDEPTSGLDTSSCDRLFDLLQLIKSSMAGSVTIIMVIHQPSHELYQQIDDIFFLTPTCCLAYQGPREKARNQLSTKLFGRSHNISQFVRRNECDTCFIMLTEAPEHIENHDRRYEITKPTLSQFSLKKRMLLPFLYVILRSIRQNYVRRAVAEAAYMVAYFILGTCIGYLFENKQQGTCDILVLPTIYFLISLAFGILTCISSQRLFGVEIMDMTYLRESRNSFHPFQYWLAKSLVDVVRMIMYPLLFLSMLYIEVVPRGPFSYYLGVMILLSFVCNGIGQLTSVIFNRTEYAYLAGTIIALLSCLLSGFSPTKAELGSGSFIVLFSFSRHVQRLLFRYETNHYLKVISNTYVHIWSTQVAGLEKKFSFDDNENPVFWLLFLGIILRVITFLILYGKSEYRSYNRFYVTNIDSTIKTLLKCKSLRKKSSDDEIELI